MGRRVRGRPAVQKPQPMAPCTPVSDGGEVEVEVLKTLPFSPWRSVVVVVVTVSASVTPLIFMLIAPPTPVLTSQICSPVNPPKVSLARKETPSVLNGPIVLVVVVVVAHVSTPWSKLHPGGTGGPLANAGAAPITNEAPAVASATKT